jgi:hypothetical protein
MKPHFKAVLPVLLFVFSLFVVHDYIIEAADTDTQYELCYAEHGDMSLDVQSQMHALIHSFMGIPVYPNESADLLQQSTAPETHILILSSHITSVPTHPPLV